MKLTSMSLVEDNYDNQRSVTVAPGGWCCTCTCCHCCTCCWCHCQGQIGLAALCDPDEL